MPLGEYGHMIPMVTADKILKKKKSYLTSFDFYSNKKYLRMQSNSSLVSALNKQQKLVLISHDPIAKFNFCCLHSPGYHYPPLS